jgi:hypothetical protein
MKAFIALALAAGCASWTPRQAALATLSTALLVTDWQQTHSITTRCLELNPVIGACGENIPVNVYFPAVIAASLAVGHIAGDWRDTFFGALAGAEAVTVWTNASYE